MIRDVLEAQRNLAQFKSDLDSANETRSEHIESLGVHRSTPGYALELGRINLPTIAPAARGLLADQVGPSAMMERQALTSFVQAQFAISKRRRWAGVVMLIAGVIAGYTSSMLSVT